MPDEQSVPPAPTCWAAVQDLYTFAVELSRCATMQGPAGVTALLLGDERLAKLKACVAKFEEPSIRATEQQIELAEQLYEHGNDEIEIDGQALVSVTEKGFWISASVFVQIDEDDIEEVNGSVD